MQPFLQCSWVISDEGNVLVERLCTVLSDWQRQTVFVFLISISTFEGTHPNPNPSSLQSRLRGLTFHIPAVFVQ